MENATLADEVLSRIVHAERGSVDDLHEQLHQEGTDVSRRHLTRVLDDFLGGPAPTDLHALSDHEGRPANRLLIDPLSDHAQRSKQRLLIGQLLTVSGGEVLVVNDRRGTRWWARVYEGKDTADKAAPSPKNVAVALERIRGLFDVDVIVIPHGTLRLHSDDSHSVEGITVADFLYPPLPYAPRAHEESVSSGEHSHLDVLEAESIRIIREAIAVAQNPAMLFSLGKDSMVMWTLAQKAFWPEPPPFPLALIDSRWEFQEVYQVLDYISNQPGTRFLVHTNPEAVKRNVNPFDFGSAAHTDITRTQGLRQFLNEHRPDFIFGGGRRDEERSRAKERVFSLRSETHGWDPKAQRPELWNAYNTTLSKGQSMRVFPLSNWTELDVWRYIQREHIPVVPLYFSKIRPFVERDGALIAIDDERFQLEDGERVYFEPIRFRTLGCYPLTGGDRSCASSVADIISELEHTRVSERSSRVIDSDPGASMEQKKKEGYF